ncbi:hypothetical protein Taro_026924 [Colocasia esculenta]|uniref:MULE transposase domain-containing protein n=1 Tax=Colocasia esculenta TaxID=4460 RepID=A0A843V7E3_COLES|nr:hypothetical protein [Colocasia esculenta]
MLLWYNQRAIDTNLRTIVDHQVEVETQCFKLYFLCFGACAYGYEVGCRPILFLDATHIKHRLYRVILAASALNGNNELYTIVYAIADVETHDNLLWFLTNLKKALLSDRTTIFISDRGKGLKEAILAIFPNHHNAYCFQHITQNFNDQAAGKCRPTMKKLLVKILKRIVYAVTEHEYAAAMRAMELQSLEAKQCVLQNDVDHWSHALFPEQRFGELYSNLAGSFNAWILDTQTLPILHMLQQIPCKHVCTVIACNGESVSGYVSPFYNKEMYKVAYQQKISINPNI